MKHAPTEVREHLCQCTTISFIMAQCQQPFAGDPGGELQPPQLTEIAWEKSDVYNAIKRMKQQKSADERGLVAELLKYAPDFFIAK